MEDHDEAERDQHVVEDGDGGGRPPHRAPEAEGDVDELEDEAEDRDLDRLPPQLGADRRPHDLGRGLEHRVLAVAARQRLADGLGLGGEVGVGATLVRQADEHLVLRRVVVGLDGGAGGHLVHRLSHLVHVRPALEARDDLGARGELHPVAHPVGRDVGHAGQDEGEADPHEDLGLAQELVVRVLQDLHCRVLRC